MMIYVYGFLVGAVFTGKKMQSKIKQDIEPLTIK
jgi:hypothetical protein